MAEPVRHRQTKEAATDMFDLQPLRHTSTLPTAAVRERPGKRRLLARQRRDSGRHPSGSHQGWGGHTSAQPVHASSKMSYTQSTFV